MTKKIVLIMAFSLSFLLLTGCGGRKTLSDVDNTEIKKTFSQSTTSAQYQSYSQKGLEEWLAAWKQVVLFFAADWCPLCRKLDADLTKNINTLPEDLLILTIDYDGADDLKKEYWISSQHTLVYLDNAWDIALSNIKDEVTLQDILDMIGTL